MTTKRQFLDPIGAGCRFVLLKSFEPNAKLRITDHTVQVVPDSIFEKMIYRPWVYKDSREDIAALYPVIVRFIELYLIAKKKAIIPNQSNQSNQLNQTNQQNKSKQKKQNTNFDLFAIDDNDLDDSFGMSTSTESNDKFDKFDKFDKYDDSENDNNSDIPQNKINQVNQITSLQKTEDDTTDECYESLIIIAQYMIEGMEELQKTYEFGNAVFALQYYKELLQAGISGTYNQDMLPKHLQDFTSKNFLDNDKIKGLWKNDDIISVARLFKLCFGPEKKTPSAIKAYRAAIESMLNDRDHIFKQMISSTNNS